MYCCGQRPIPTERCRPSSGSTKCFSKEMFNLTDDEALEQLIEFNLALAMFLALVAKAGYERRPTSPRRRLHQLPSSR